MGAKGNFSHDGYESVNTPSNFYEFQARLAIPEVEAMRPHVLCAAATTPAAAGDEHFELMQADRDHCRNPTARPALADAMAVNENIHLAYRCMYVSISSYDLL